MQQDLTPETYWDRILHQPIQEDCPMRRTLELLSGKWRLYVLYVLSKASVCRFGALKRAIPGITSTMLTHAAGPGDPGHRPPGTVQRGAAPCGVLPDGEGPGPSAGVHRTGQMGGDLFRPLTSPRWRGQHAPKQCKARLAPGWQFASKDVWYAAGGLRFPGGSQEAPVRRYASKIPPFCEEVFWILCPNCKPWHSR